MIWVVAVVVVGLIAVLAELMLSFQKKADELRQIQSPIKRRIRAHQEAMQEAVKNIENAATGRIDELDMQMPAYTNQLTGFGKRLSEVETEIFGLTTIPRHRLWKRRQTSSQTRARMGKTKRREIHQRKPQSVRGRFSMRWKGTKRAWRGIWRL